MDVGQERRVPNGRLSETGCGYYGSWLYAEEKILGLSGSDWKCAFCFRLDVRRIILGILSNQIISFNNVSDDEYLLQRVIFIVGVFGGCRINELVAIQMMMLPENLFDLRTRAHSGQYRL